MNKFCWHHIGHNYVAYCGAEHALAGIIKEVAPKAPKAYYLNGRYIVEDLTKEQIEEIRIQYLDLQLKTAQEMREKKDNV